jgi:hypothetical protein
VTFPDRQQHRFEYQVEDHRSDDCCHAFVATGNDGPFQCARTSDAGSGTNGCQRF